MRKDLNGFHRDGSVWLSSAREPWENLRLIRQYRTAKIGTLKPCEGFDTETERGNVRILADSKEVLYDGTFEDNIRFLVRRGRRGSFNIFWNLHYDVESIFKAVPEVAAGLVTEEPVKYGRYTFQYLQRKRLTIKTPGKHMVTFYDVAQFYHSSLAAASLRYLGEPAHELKGERGTMFQRYPLEEIGAYCLDDCDRTRRLGDTFLMACSELGFLPRSLLSCGTLSQEYTLKGASIPLLEDVPRVVARMAWQSYRGGWFDCYKRGLLRASHYDITSAYPWAMRDLPDVRDGEWIPGYDCAATLGFYAVEINRNRHDFSPLSWWSMGTNIYADFDEPVRGYVELDELRALRHDFGLKILYGYSFIAEPDCRFPYRALVDSLYEWKQRTPKEDGRYIVVKQIINSLYGKCAQRRKDGDEHIIGQLFNPVYAAATTARCRTLIYRAFKEQHKRIYAVHTDSIICHPKVKIQLEAKLGGWSVEHQDLDVLMLQTGIYQFESDRAHTRGFDRRSDLWEACHTSSPMITVKQTRPWHLKECLKRGDLTNVGDFSSHLKHLDLNKDKKRLWPERIREASDLLMQSFESAPVPSSLICSLLYQG